MANLAELFQRLEKFEKTQKELQASKAELEATIKSLKKRHRGSARYCGPIETIFQHA